MRSKDQRIAMINDGLWSELFLNNKDFLLKRIEEFENHLDKLKDALKEKNQEEIQKLMRSATSRRSMIK